MALADPQRTKRSTRSTRPADAELMKSGRHRARLRDRRVAARVTSAFLDERFDREITSVGALGLLGATPNMAAPG